MATVCRSCLASNADVAPASALQQRSPRGQPLASRQGSARQKATRETVTLDDQTPCCCCCWCCLDKRIHHRVYPRLKAVQTEARDKIQQHWDSRPAGRSPKNGAKKRQTSPTRDQGCQVRWTRRSGVQFPSVNCACTITLKMCEVLPEASVGMSSLEETSGLYCVELTPGHGAETARAESSKRATRGRRNTKFFLEQATASRDTRDPICVNAKGDLNERDAPHHRRAPNPEPQLAQETVVLLHSATAPRISAPMAACH